MDYRLVCIFDTSAQERCLDIEVCLETGSKSLSPFQRRVRISDIRNSGNFKRDRLAQLLFNCGQEKQPFKFTEVQLADAVVRQVIGECTWLYVRKGGKGSTLRRTGVIDMLESVSPMPGPFVEGKLIGAELYVNNIKRWWQNIGIRFRYEDCTCLFPASFTSIPTLSEHGCYFIRNAAAEKEKLQDICYSIDYIYSTFDLEGPDVAGLAGLVRNGWKLYVPSKDGRRMNVHIQSNRSGISWFSTDRDKTASDSDMMPVLQAYLTGRNYIESDGRIELFDARRIKSAASNEIMAALVPGRNLERLYEELQPLTSDEEKRIRFVVSRNVNACLKDYQMDGVLWLSMLRKNGKGAMLADDMGLGKTLQTLAFLSTLGTGKQYLVVCPASIISNWKKEIRKFIPELEQMIRIESYDAIRINIDKFDKIPYDTIIVDEGQFVKNDETFRYRAIESLKRDYLIVLSGTPIENSVREIWAQFKLIFPETEFIYNKLVSIAEVDDNKIAELSKMFLSRFILRRTKEDVLPDMPDMSVENIYLNLSDEERRIYEKVRRTFVLAMDNGISGRINSIALEGLLRLRQCCVSVNLLPRSLSGKGYVFSSKMSNTLRIVKNLIGQNHKVLVFSQFTSALNELEKHLDNEGIMPLLLTGETRNRHEIIEKFQKDTEFKVFLISLKAGGTGLNLTAADRVVLLDDWWNPAVESQAFSRAHRIGQDNNVKVYRLVCRDTVEEKILALHKNKKDISDLFNSVNQKMSMDEIRKLIG